MSELSTEAVSVRRMTDTHAQQTQYTPTGVRLAATRVWNCFLPRISGLMSLIIFELAIEWGRRKGRKNLLFTPNNPVPKMSPSDGEKSWAADGGVIKEVHKSLE